MPEFKRRSLTEDETREATQDALPPELVVLRNDVNSLTIRVDKLEVADDKEIARENADLRAAIEKAERKASEDAAREVSQAAAIKKDRHDRMYDILKLVVAGILGVALSQVQQRFTDCRGAPTTPAPATSSSR